MLSPSCSSSSVLVGDSPERAFAASTNRSSKNNKGEENAENDENGEKEQNKGDN
jgi:hypothetical protein